MPLPELGAPESFEQLFLGKIKEERERVDRHVLNGNCPDHGKYMWYTGQHLGLTLAETWFKELVSEWENR